MNTPELNNAQDMSYPILSKSRRKMAVKLIERLSDPVELRYVLDSLNDTVVYLIERAAEASGNQDNQEELINQLCYITNVADALIYLAGNNPINQNDHE